jgi:hypothetical protein
LSRLAAGLEKAEMTAAGDLSKEELQQKLSFNQILK